MLTYIPKQLSNSNFNFTVVLKSAVKGLCNHWLMKTNHTGFIAHWTQSSFYMQQECIQIQTWYKCAHVDTNWYTSENVSNKNKTLWMCVINVQRQQRGKKGWRQTEIVWFNVSPVPSWTTKNCGGCGCLIPACTFCNVSSLLSTEVPFHSPEIIKNQHARLCWLLENKALLQKHNCCLLHFCKHS